jgi:outer membrane protein OmpA-like peptidoglycan-associated protein
MPSDGVATTRTLPRGRVLLAVIVASVLLVAACSDDPEKDAAKSSTTTKPSTTESTTTTKPTTTTTKPPEVSVEGTTSQGAKMVQPHRGIYRDGKLYLEGAVPSRKVGDQLKAKANAVLGPQNVVDHYVIDPAAPAVTDGKVIVDEPFLFGTGSTEIAPGYESLLTLGIAVMKLNPQVIMVVRGYTDSVGDDATNLRLSQGRAQAVANWIIFHGQIPANRFQLEGRGEADPVGDNNTEQGKALNRRIEVELLHLIG